MKKVMMMIWMGAMVGMMGGCDTYSGGSQHDPNSNCWVFVRTTPGEETILLAKSGLAVKEAFAIRDGFVTQYGKNEVVWSDSYPGAIPNIDPDAVTNCYEFTMVVEFAESSVPSISSLLGMGFEAVRINGYTAICKGYGWAYTYEDAEAIIPSYEKVYMDYEGVGGGGTIIDIAVKKLGIEIHNMAIEF